MRPIIGVTPLWDDEKNSIWMLPGYLDAIREAGAIPITLPLVATYEDIMQICAMCDGFLLTGGHDISPTLYGEEPTERCGIANHNRDSLEREIFNYSVESDTPLLGICRGIQIINALCGGTLYQDLPTEYNHSTSVNHQMQAPYDQPCHKVKLIDGSPLAEITGAVELSVNSYHHQAIKELAPTLKAMAISEDGIIEAIYMPGKRFIQALQWHPEFNFHCEESSRKIVKTFIDKTTSK